MFAPPRDGRYHFSGAQISGNLVNISGEHPRKRKRSPEEDGEDEYVEFDSMPDFFNSPVSSGAPAYPAHGRPDFW